MQNNKKNIEIYSSIKEVTEKLDTKGIKSDNPFASINFYEVLEVSGVISKYTGWEPIYICYIEDNKLLGILYSFKKYHSYGEYIFDWSWANFYAHHKIPYYPKLLAATPFSPINAPKGIYQNSTIKEKLLRFFNATFMNISEISSSHILFIDNSYKLPGYHLRSSLQFHFKNTYKSFEDFLSQLKARKRKNIRRERKSVQESNLRIEKYENNFPKDIYKEIYQLYITTVDKKFSQAYLNESFFKNIISEMPQNIIIFCAYKDKELIAMSFFLKSSQAIYGRYWGIKNNHDYPNLHFELCYYRGIEYCIQNNIELFEAGAQGEQKLLRGFEPVIIKSLHKMKDPQIDELIENFIKEEDKEIEKISKQYIDYLPYK